MGNASPLLRACVRILDFPAKQDIFLKIKELCHLEHKTPEQMPFKFLRYLISSLSIKKVLCRLNTFCDILICYAVLHRESFALIPIFLTFFVI